MPKVHAARASPGRTHVGPLSTPLLTNAATAHCAVSGVIRLAQIAACDAAMRA